MPAGLIDLIMRRRRAVLIFFAVLLMLAGAGSSTLFDKLKGGGFNDPGAESGVAAEVLRDQFGQGQPNLVLLVDAPGSVDDAGVAAAATALVQRLTGEAGVTGVTSYWTSGHPPALRSADGSQGLVVATILGDDDAVEDRITDLEPRYSGIRDGLDVQVGGYAMLQHEMVEQSEKDAITGESIAFPITLIALVLVFGSVMAALLPLAVAMVTVLLTMGAMWLLAGVTDLNALAINVVTLLGLGLAIDYSLLIVSRYREELDAGVEPAQALRTTMNSAGRTVAFSAVTVAVALSGLVFFPLLAVRSVGYAGIAVALIAALSSLTVLPALLAILGSRVDKWRIRRRDKVSRELHEGRWHRLAMFVMRRPGTVAITVTVVLLFLGAPFLGLKLGYPDERSMPEASSSRQVAEVVRAEFDTSEQSALSVVLPQGGSGVPEYAQRLSALPEVQRVDTVSGSYADGVLVAPATELNARFAANGGVYLSVVPATDDSAVLEDLVGTIREVDAPSDALVGGVAAVSADATDALLDRLPIALGVVLALMLILLFLLTGSVFLPVVAVLLSCLSLTATFGALVWIFQDGHLSELLGFTVTGTLASTVPIMLFGVAFGLAMDYQVFLLSRIREEYERTGDGTAAVAIGLERIGRIVTAAAVLISVVFLGFLVSDITFMKAFGIGLPLAVLADATLIRGFLLPATMQLGGRWTWWAPGPLRKLHERFGIREGAGSPDRDRDLVEA
ncbi:MMPL family transporter [Nocardia cyriacigeorgica]|uniref:MMPL family transporter n=1 Tax=Nocardia cyriacigeorgica TaxID=135487 RepID=UPI00249005E1|nr:MMPL family transporter [Nocardia cyriacigeorgica]BDU08492.1 membrane protein [Nocardia cyriacigeorgica]